MKTLKNFLIAVFIIAGTILILPNNVFADDNKEDLIKLVAPDGENATFKVKKPSSFEEADLTLNGYVQRIINKEGYELYITCNPEDLTKCDLDIKTEDYRTTWNSELGREEIVSGWRHVYNLNITYDAPTSNSTVDNYFNKLNNFEIENPNTYYIVEDLSLINYYLTSIKSELWNVGAPGRALKYSSINNITDGANISYFLDIRAGIQDENNMYESAFGPMSIYYNDYSYGTKEEGVYLKRVIYIPQSTDDSKEAYVLAAQKRINDYLGNESVTVTYGGLLSSLPEDSEDDSYPITNDGNYYNINIGGRVYKFYIVKGTDKQLEKPSYKGTDIVSNIEITSSNSSIPLDTSLTVSDVNDTNIKDIIGTSNYKSYDIILFSDAKNSRIRELENGKFQVKMPIPDALSGKNFIVYYIDTDNKIEKHTVEFIEENGVRYAVFETNHFSVYTLAVNEVVEDNTTTDTSTSTIEVPNTGDQIVKYIVIAGICIAVIVVVIIFNKTNKKGH